MLLLLITKLCTLSPADTNPTGMIIQGKLCGKPLHKLVDAITLHAFQTQLRIHASGGKFPAPLTLGFGSTRQTCSLPKRCIPLLWCAHTLNSNRDRVCQRDLNKPFKAVATRGARILLPLLIQILEYPSLPTKITKRPCKAVTWLLHLGARFLRPACMPPGMSPTGQGPSVHRPGLKSM